MATGPIPRAVRAVHSSGPWAFKSTVPFYAVFSGDIAGTGINEMAASLFVSSTTARPSLCSLALLGGLLVFSSLPARSKWVIEDPPYVLLAANSIQVNWMGSFCRSIRIRGVPNFVRIQLECCRFSESCA